MKMSSVLRAPKVLPLCDRLQAKSEDDHKNHPDHPVMCRPSSLPLRPLSPWDPPKSLSGVQERVPGQFKTQGLIKCFKTNVPTFAPRS